MAIQDGVFVGQLNVRHALEVMAQITARQFAKETGQPPVNVKLVGLRRKDGKDAEGQFWPEQDGDALPSTAIAEAPRRAGA